MNEKNIAQVGRRHATVNMVPAHGRQPAATGCGQSGTAIKARRAAGRGWLGVIVGVALTLLAGGAGGAEAERKPSPTPAAGTKPFKWQEKDRLVTFAGEIQGVICLNHRVNTNLAQAILFLGITDHSQLRKVRVNRLVDKAGGANGKCFVFTVNVKDIVEHRAPDVRLEGGDIITTPRALFPTRWEPPQKWEPLPLLPVNRHIPR